MKNYNRRTAQVVLSDHALRDKNLNRQDIDNAIETVRSGKIDSTASRNNRICYKKYFKLLRETYFVVTAYYPDMIKIITVIKKKGKY